jgi:hypothetical protein
MTRRSRFALLFALLLPAAFAPAQNGSLPYTLTFEPSPQPSTLPALQSYCLANVSPTQWLILGGRRLGLHQFNPPPANNFMQPNTILWSINPVTQTATEVADLSQLPPSIGDPLTSTNQQCEYNSENGNWYIVGGYGLSRASNNTFVTFNTIFQVSAARLAAIASSNSSSAEMQAAVAQLLQGPNIMITNDALKDTGGVLSHNAAGLEFLSFGQVFNGSYNPFGSGFSQTYTQNVQPFTIATSPLSIRTLQPITSSSKDKPFNRRDFAATYDIDPATGQDRFAVFGGVFRPGAIAGYDYPVYITGSGINVSVTPDQTVKQHFGFYQSPIIVVWDGSKVYHTFFGGIGHYFYTQSAPQKTVYKYVTKNGRNDGLPFIEDIDTLIENSSGSYAEYIAPQPVPGNMLHGAAIDFIPNLALSDKFQGIGGNVINLSKFTPGEKELIGYIYGGVEADYPLPCQPSHGTQATNQFYQVFLTMTPWSGQIPADQATEALGYYTHGDPNANKQATAKTKARASGTPPAECTNNLLTHPAKPNPAPKHEVKGDQ